MWVIAMMAAVLAALLGPLLAGRPAEEHAVSTASARALAESMAAYRTAVVAWAQGQPGFEGVVSDADVAGPAWLRRSPSIRAAVEGRIVAVYLAQRPPAGVLDEMLRLSGSSIWVGIARQPRGTLDSPGLGDTGLPVPRWVPDQAPAWLALRS